MSQIVPSGATAALGVDSEIDQIFKGVTERRYAPIQQQPQSINRVYTEGGGGGGEEELGFFDTVGDMVKGAGAGVYDAVAETANLVPDIANLVMPDDNQFGDIMDPASKTFGYTPETVWGEGSKAVSQFITGFIGAGKILKAGQILQGAGKAATVARGAVQGFITDFTAFDSHEANLANVVERFPAVGNPITDYLASKEDDGAAYGRLKNAITGLVPGVAGECLAVGVKAFRAGRAAKSIEEADALAAKAVDEMNALASKAEAGNGSVAGKAVTGGVEDAQRVLTPEEFTSNFETALTNGKTIDEALEEGVNIGSRATFDSVEEARTARAYAEAIYEHTLKGKGVEPHNFLREHAQEWIQRSGLDEIAQAAINDRGVMEDMSKRFLTYRVAEKNTNHALGQLYESLKQAGKNPAESEEFIRLSHHYQDLSRASKDIGTSVARSLNSMKVDPDYLPPNLMMAVIKATGGSSEDILRVLNKVQGNKVGSLGKGYMEVIINGLLSGPKTHLVNIAGNATKSLIMPVEKIIGGAVTLDKQMANEGFHTLMGVGKYLSESWKACSMAWKTGDNILDAGNKIMDSQSHQPIFTTYERIKKDMLVNLQAKGVDVSNGLPKWQGLQARFQSFVGVPSRALLSMDEFFKQINYRAHTYGQLVAEGMAQKMDDASLEAFVKKGMDGAFDGTGKGINKDSLRYGQEATWTQSLKDGAYINIGKGMESFARTTPAARLVVPFIKTPTNLYRDFVAHTPGINLLTKRFHDAIRAGGEQRAQALGATATGSFFWVSAITAASSGKITGGYPKDPTARQAWIDAGIEPYSFRIGDTYLSYARAEPFAAIFGIAADFSEHYRNWDDSSKANLANHAMVALASNLTSKSYMTGLTDLMAALTDDSTDSSKMAKYLQRTSGMLVPFSSGVRFARQIADDPMREVRSIADNYQNMFPGLSDNLPEKRSWITGKHISNNVFWGTHKNDPVTTELASLGDNLSAGPPPRTYKGIELTGQQYSRLCELQGTIKINGLTQHERLERLMKSSAYDMGRKRLPDMPGSESNPRTKMVDDVIKQYREAAQRRLLRDDDSLQQATQTQLKAKLAAKRGDRERYIESKGQLDSLLKR